MKVLYSTILISLILLLLSNSHSFAQYEISSGLNTIDFTGFTGTGLSSASAVTGTLDSDEWAVDLDDDGTLDADFGATNTSTPYNGGNTETGTGTEGIFYAYSVGSATPVYGMTLYTNNASDPDEFNSIILKIENNTGGIITELAIDYSVYYRGKNSKTITLAFEHSSDNSTFIDPGTLDYTVNASGNAWTQAASPSVSATVTGLSIATGDPYYLKWIFQDAENGSGAAIALDEINMTPTVVNPSSTSTITVGSAGSSTISSLITTATGQEVFDFTFLDDGAGSSDGFNTMISKFVIDEGTSDAIADWSDVLAGASLSDGTVTATASSIGTNTITFSGFDYTTSGDLGFIADGASKTYTLSIWLNTSISESIDNQLLHMMTQTSGFTFFGASSALISTETASSSTTNNTITVVPTTWAFKNIPNSVGTSLGFSLDIAATDVNGNIDVDETSTFDLTLNSGSGSLTSATGLTQSVSAGAFSFSDLSISADGSFDLIVSTNTGTALSSATSATIVAAEAYRSVVASGNWSDNATWEFFSNGAWTTASSSPTSADGPITIQSGHAISFNSAATVDQITIESGATLTLDATLTLSDVSGENDLIVSGTLSVPGTNLTINPGATVEIETGGVITTNSNAMENALAGADSSGEIIYNHGAIFEYTNTSQNGFDDTTYFPDVSSSEIPIMRITGITGTINNLPSTSINGILEVNSNLGIGSNVTIDIRNGITGTGSPTINGATEFTMSGDSLFFGGIGVIDLGGQAIVFSSTQIISLTTDKEIQDGSFTFSSGSKLYSSDNFQLHDGTANDMTVTFSSGANFQLEGSNGLSDGLSGLIDVNTLSFSSGANFEFSGAVAQTTNFASIGLSSINNLVINNAAGVTLSEALSIEGSLTLTSGNLMTTTTNLPTLSDSSPFSGGSSASFIDGPVTLSNFTASVTFPIGDGSDFREVTLDPVTSSSFTVEHFSSTPPDESDLTSPLSSLLDLRYWELTRDNGTGDVEVTLNFDEAADGVTGSTDLRLSRYNTGSTSWEASGTGYDSHSSTTITATTSTFSSYTIGSIAAVLPVELTSFTGRYIADEMLLEWTTASELNNDYFEVQHSFDGIAYEKIGQINGSGTTNEISDYSYTDSHSNAGDNYYRLKQVDYDGASEFSPSISVFVEERFSNNYLIYPNPVNGNDLSVVVKSVSEGQVVNYTISDLTGNQVFEAYESVTSSSYDQPLPVSSLASGSYILTISHNGLVKRMVFIRN